ncbi:MAG: energy transducer TonB [Thermodesulfobacteriota bacterium]|nr:energy transducer TonB [Thermodesulfobacteriota bacterium]
MNKSTKIAFAISLFVHVSVFCLTGFGGTSPPVKDTEISFVIDQTTENTPVAEKQPAVKNKVIKKQSKTIKGIPGPIIDPHPHNSLTDTLFHPEKTAIAMNNSQPKLPEFRKERIHDEDLATGRRGLLQWYLDLIWKRIEVAKVYPEKARIDMKEGVAKVQFIVREDGDVADMRVIESSGKRQLDQASLETIVKAKPFPPIPPLLEMKEMVLKLPIVFELKRR